MVTWLSVPGSKAAGAWS